jgi:hypothetical protein
MLKILDISNLNAAGYLTLPQYAACDGLIIQAIPRPRPDGLTGEQMHRAVADSKFVAPYSWLWNDPSWRMDPDVRVDQRIRMATIPEDVEIDGRAWIDTEDNQSDLGKAHMLSVLRGQGRLIPLQQAKDDLMFALDEWDNWSVKRGMRLTDTGVYWSAYYIELLYDGWQPDGRKQWRADYGPNPHPNPGIIIDEVTVGHQYTSIPIDQSVFIDSEFVASAEEDSVRIPDDYVKKFDLPDNHSQEALDALIANLEGVITQTREIAFAQGQGEASDAVGQINAIKKLLGGQQIA